MHIAANPSSRHRMRLIIYQRSLLITKTNNLPPLSERHGSMWLWILETVFHHLQFFLLSSTILDVTFSFSTSQKESEYSFLLTVSPSAQFISWSQGLGDSCGAGNSGGYALGALPTPPCHLPVHREAAHWATHGSLPEDLYPGCEVLLGSLRQIGNSIELIPWNSPNQRRMKIKWIKATSFLAPQDQSVGGTPSVWRDWAPGANWLYKVPFMLLPSLQKFPALEGWFQGSPLNQWPTLESQTWPLWRNPEILTKRFWTDFGIQAESVWVILNQLQLVLKKFYASLLFLFLLEFMIFRAFLGSWKTCTECIESSCIPCGTCSVPTVSVLHQSGTLVITDKAAMTCPHVLKSIVYLRVHSWCCSFILWVWTNV